MAKILKISSHIHELQPEEEKVPWYCDSLVFSDRCESDQTAFCSYWPGRKFGCKNACGLLFCEQCVVKNLIPQEFSYKLRLNLIHSIFLGELRKLNTQNMITS